MPKTRSAFPATVRGVAPSWLVLLVAGYTWRPESDACIPNREKRYIRTAAKQIKTDYQTTARKPLPSNRAMIASSWMAAKQTAQTFLEVWPEFVSDKNGGTILNQYFDPDCLRDRKLWLHDWMFANLLSLSDPAKDDCVVVVVTYPAVIEHLLGSSLPGADLQFLKPTEWCLIEVHRSFSELAQFQAQVSISCPGSRREGVFDRVRECFCFSL